jgi:hypothetical protein
MPASPPPRWSILIPAFGRFDEITDLVRLPTPHRPWLVSLACPARRFARDASLSCSAAVQPAPFRYASMLRSRTSSDIPV